MKIILASASPRRKQLLKQMGLEFDVIPSNVEEELPDNLPYEEAVQELAFRKALHVASVITDQCIIIGADTIVVKGEVIGKPRNRQEAREMLYKLQGQTHEVITGLALIDTATGKTKKAFEKTIVKMTQLSMDEIERYVLTGEPMDKAGAYGIQGLAGIFISSISGCYYNVVGLPIHRLWVMLKEFGVNPLFLNKNIIFFSS